LQKARKWILAELLVVKKKYTPHSIIDFPNNLLDRYDYESRIHLKES
jgi:hypothetical protein